MSNKNSERFSALVDGELDNFDQDLERLSKDKELQARWMRYHLIRDVISGHAPEKSTINLADKVSQALENEPTVLAPRHRYPQQFLKQAAGLAIAATVSTVAIISFQNTSINETNFSPASIAKAPTPSIDTNTQLAHIPTPAANNVVLSSAGNKLNTKPTQFAQPQQPVPISAMGQTSESKLSRYLVNHNEYSKMTQMHGMLPYMRIVGVTPNSPVAQATNEK